MNKTIGLLWVAFLLWGCSPSTTAESSLLYYIPSESDVIIKIRDMAALKSDLKNNAFLQQTNQTPTARSIVDAVGFFDFLDQPGECILAFVPGEEETSEFVFATQRHDSVLNKKRIDSTAIIKNKDFNTLELGGQTVYVETHGEILVVSSSSQLLRGVISAADKEEINNELNVLYGAANLTPSATVILRVSNNSRLVKKVFSEDLSYDISSFAQWLSFDINTGQDELALNGITLVTNDSTSVLGLFKNTQPLSHITPLLAPSNTLATLSFTFDSHKIFSQNQLPFLESTTAMDSIFNTVEEVGFMYLPREKAVVLQTFGTENIADYLEGQQRGVIDYQGKEIIALKEPRFLNVQFYPLVKKFDANYYTILENAFVFGETEGALQGIIRNYNAGTTLNKQNVYSGITSTIADESHILFLAKPEGISTILENELNGAIIKDLNKASLREFAYAAQVVADDHFYHSNISIRKIAAKAKKNTATALFTIQLENEVVSNPQFVTNHRTRQKEIVVQDENNYLYLISTKGKILWKKDVGGRIQGKIHQVDLYKNGRLQLAFTTDSQFLVLDRNGKIVKPFNKKYPGGNLNPLAVFDYENNRNYRLVVTQGAKVFMYNNKGSIVDGFTYKEASSPIVMAPSHFRIGKRDYLVFALEDGSLKILNRIGKTRIPISDKINFSGNPVFYYRDKFTVSDKKGTLYQYDTNGKRSTTRLNLGEYHGVDATTKTLATMNNHTLRIKGRNNNLELGVYTSPKIFYLDDTIYVSVTDLQSQQVYMYYSNSRSLPGFPVFGGSAVDLADMDNDRKLEMVTRDQEKSLVVYRLN